MLTPTQIDQFILTIENFVFFGFKRISDWDFKTSASGSDATLAAMYGDDNSRYVSVRYSIIDAEEHYVMRTVVDLDSHIEIRSFQVSDITAPQLRIGLIQMFSGLKEEIEGCR